MAQNFLSKARSDSPFVPTMAVGLSIGSRENKSDRAIRMTLSLAFLDPKLVKAAMQGVLPRGVSARRLVDAPSTWAAQWQAIGLSRPN